MAIELGADPGSKCAWRERLLAARRTVPAEIHAAQAHALASGALSVPGDVVCAYVPFGTEPGSLTLLDALIRAGRRVLLPVTRETGPLNWADYRGPDGLRRGPFRSREPDGELLGPDAISWADVIFVPALAVDRLGVRLGRGAGFYDRSLPRATGQLVAVIRDEEFVAALPAEPHDVRMTAVLTPSAGLRWLR